ncbi:hypothetical protein GCM10022140_25650 [Rhodococcus aetherivorans]|uniref:hypothetical protein n=1 Tax=Rhodococcus aetherivorans TaxID=191292 RepID=UPI0005C133B4|nr:hypothetical protein [Rhodococcus aetherivorans]NGP26401.1 hypothetical protein [Rhodococcus aetherivorans]
MTVDTDQTPDDGGDEQTSETHDDQRPDAEATDTEAAPKEPLSPRWPRTTTVSSSLIQTVRDNPLWVLGLLPLVLVCFRLIYVSRGDTEVMRALLASIDILRIVLATVLPVMPVLMFWGIVLLIDRWRITRKEERPAMPALLPAFVITLLLVSLTGMTILTAVASIASVMVVAAQIWRAQRKGGPRSYRLKATEAIGLAVLTCLTASVGPWLPTEAIKLTDGSQYVGYALSADARWFQFLDDDNVLHVEASTSVESRTPCTKVGNWYVDTTFRALQRHRGQEVAPRCPEQPSQE